MTVAEFRTFFAPSFDDTDPAKIQQQLTLSLNHLDPDRFGIYAAEATACWVAHWLLVNAADGPKLAVDANDVTSRATENITIGRDAQLLAKQQANPYLRTTFGQRYQYLSDIAGVGAVAVGGC